VFRKLTRSKKVKQREHYKPLLNSSIVAPVVLAPKRSPLPITETGYRAHFTAPETVADNGGPVSYVEAWLETESQAHDGRRMHQARQQLSLL